MVTGVDPEGEARVSRIKKLIREGRYLSANDVDKALIGSLLARNLRITVGDELTMLGQGRDGSIAATIVTVKGIFSSGIDEFDRATIYLPLTLFQDIFSMQGAVHQVVVVGRSLSAVPEIKEAILPRLAALNSRAPLVALDWQELMPGLRQSIELDLISGAIFYSILILVVAFSILNTFLMAILERTREFGVMMAVGTTPQRLTKLVLTESLALTAIGTGMGILMGCLVTFYFQKHGIDISGSSDMLSQFGITGRIFPKLTVISTFAGPLAVLIITFLAALLPTRKIKRLKPVEAMYHT
jgi:ABC-type lipoprotein release transport system permease subunit